MSEQKMGIWNSFSKPPKEALREIGGGRLKGMTDINPQWRYKAMTEKFGPCGIGWYPEIVEIWTEPVGVEIAIFVKINLYIRNVRITSIPKDNIKDEDAWSKPIPGLGGNLLAANERNGLHLNDESLKMAYTDALSVAMKMIGVASDIYMGLWDGSKYRDDKPEPPAAPPFDVKAARIKLRADMTKRWDNEAKTKFEEVAAEYMTRHSKVLPDVNAIKTKEEYDNFVAILNELNPKQGESK